MRDLSPSLLDFLDRHAGAGRNQTDLTGLEFSKGNA
jgi:hypothetical protein